ncbi:phytoene desaturase family protein, partial [Reichenbachiella sp.]
MHKVHIIGSGFSSLATGCYLAKAGYEVTLLEKNNTIGGRAREMHKDGFRFDMGPSWYWMPDVFDKFFQDFGHQTSDFYELIKLSPSYRVHFEDEEYIDVPDSLEEIYKVFDQLEPGSAVRLKEFLALAKTNYEIAMKDLVYKPGLSPLELVTPSTALRLNQFIQTVSSQVRKRFTNPKLIKILEFPVLFLGAKPQNTPGFYNFMNWADFGLGTWYPKGGMVQVIKGMEKLFLSLGGKIETNSPVDKIEYANNR